MSQISIQKIRQLSRSRAMCTIFLGIWLFCVNVSIAHSQEHVLASDNSCQFCLTHFKNTPFVLTSELATKVNVQSSFVALQPYFFKPTLCQLITGNRDPPIY